MSYLLNAIKKKDSDVFQAPFPGPYAHKSLEVDNQYNDELVEVPDIRQNDDYSCGACAAMSVGKFYGVGPATIEEWKKALGTNVKKSTDPEKIRGFLESIGLQVVCKHKMTTEELGNYHKSGVPVICPIQEYGIPNKQASYNYGHYVVSLGVGFGYVFVQDPSIDNVMEGEGSDNADGRMMIRKDKFNDVWHDEDLYGKEYDHFGMAVSGPRGE